MHSLCHCVQQKIQPTSENLIEVEILIQSMISHPVLGKIVGPYPLTAVTRTNQILAFTRPFFMLNLPLPLIDPCLQYPQCFRKVLVLAFFILTLHNDTRLQDVSTAPQRLSYLRAAHPGPLAQKRSFRYSSGRNGYFDIFRFRQTLPQSPLMYGHVPWFRCPEHAALDGHRFRTEGAEILHPQTLLSQVP